MLFFMFNSTTCIFVHPNLLCFRSLSFLFHFACYVLSTLLHRTPCKLVSFTSVGTTLYVVLLPHGKLSSLPLRRCTMFAPLILCFFLLHEWRIIHGITLLGGTLLRILPKWLATCFEMTPTNEHNLTSNIYSWYDFMILENYLTWNDLNWKSSYLKITPLCNLFNFMTWEKYKMTCTKNRLIFKMTYLLFNFIIGKMNLKNRLISNDLFLSWLTFWNDYQSIDDEYY